MFCEYLIFSLLTKSLRPDENGIVGRIWSEGRSLETPGPIHRRPQCTGVHGLPVLNDKTIE